MAKSIANAPVNVIVDDLANALDKCTVNFKDNSIAIDNSISNIINNGLAYPKGKGNDFAKNQFLAKDGEIANV